MGEEIPDFGLGVRVRKEERKKNQNFYLQSTEFCRLEFVEPRVKVHLLDKGYAWVQKTRDFAEDLREEFEKSKVSSLESVHETS